MDISDLLKAAVFTEFQDQESVLNELASLLSAKPSEKIVCDLREHESISGALSDTDSAVFHCLSEEVSEPVIALAISKKGVPDGIKRKLHLFFLIISPMKESGTHLQLLSKIEGLLLDKAFQHAVLDLKGSEDVKKEIKKIEGSARSLYIPLGKDEVFDELGTSQKGLTEEEFLKRIRLTGPNELRKIYRGTLLRDFLYNLFLNLFAVLLWAGGVMAFISGMPELGWAIFAVIIINALFSFWQEYKAGRAVEALKKLLPKKVRVVRDGIEKETDAWMLVPGDLIRLAEGDGVPADGRLVEAQEMRVDNSALTGESKPVYKVSEPLADGRGFIWTEVPNLVFAGTMVLSGSGHMVVTATGMDTELGRVAFLTEAIKPEKSPLQKELEHVSKTITLLALAFGVFFFIFGLTVAGLKFSESFIFAIGVIVANVPEGLFPTVSLSLAMGVQRMAAKKAIVKKLSAVETLGSATVICTDKTGTLTSNQMCVREVFVNNRRFGLTGNGYDPAGNIFHDLKPLTRKEVRDSGVERLLIAAALCNNAALNPPSGDSLSWSISGDPTEAALLTAAVKAGIDLDEIKDDFIRTAHLPFERIRKRMTTIHNAKGGVNRVAFTKGSPKEVLELCNWILIDGNAQALTREDRESILRENDRMASEGLRILAVARRDLAAPDNEKEYKKSDTERDLTFLGLAAMIDPPRPEVKKAVAECKRAGIKVVMITGDYGLTAKTIAEQVGIECGRVMTGEELNGVTHGELREMLKGGGVLFARSAPNDKLRVVTALQENGEVVAVTGDGVNDAPALKKADIGVAMGLRGSDVAKESAEIVITDDNFASIVDAVREGRAVFENIRKFVIYILTHNFAELVPVIAFVTFRVPLPLTVMQMLAIDLGSDIFPALALGVEPPEKGIMDQPPRKDKRLLDLNTLKRSYLFLGPIEAALSLGAFFYAYWMRGFTPFGALPAAGVIYAAATTMTFAGVVASQVGNVFACRTERESVFSVGFLKNRFVLWSLLFETAIVLTLIYAPGLGRVFGFAPLTALDWLLLLSFPAVMLASAELRKAYARRCNPVKSA